MADTTGAVNGATPASTANGEKPAVLIIGGLGLSDTQRFDLRPTIMVLTDLY